MKKLYTLLGVIGLIAFSSTSNAQCANDNSLWLTINAGNITTGTTLSSCTYGGEYLLLTNMQSGSLYTFETCGDTDFDTQLTIFNNASGAVVAYNDDACGLQSSVTFTSDGSDVRVSLDRFNCQDESTCMTILGSVQGPNTSPCNSIDVLATCGSSANFSLSGSGSFNNNGPFGTPGAEQIYEFLAPTSGSYTINMTHSGGGWVDLFFRDAASGCNGTGWTYIDDVLSSASNTVNLTAGQTYYFMIDDENLTASSGSITIECPGPDPCDDITDLVGCDVSKDFSLSGSGSFNGNGPWSTPGEEVIYSYTAPYSGDFEITINHTGGSYIDLFFREASTGCSGSGWTYVDDIFSSASNDVFLTGGVTYYFMIDDENTSATDGNIFIACPCIPSSAPDGSFTYNGDFTISGSLNGECNDCSLRPSDDQIYEIVIPCPGTYTFETCGGASWDTYLYLTNSFCGGVISSNDDASCGGGFSLQSSITSYLLPGTYYVSVEAFSTFTNAGDFDLAVSGVIDAVDASITPQNHVIDCVPIPVDLTANVTGGTGPYTYLWSNGETTPTITVNPNTTTTYSVTVTDANNCSVDMDNTTVEVINRCGNNNQKSLICHVPSGNSGNPQTICISPNALNAHLATLWDLHGGDYCGPCASNSALITTDNTNLGDNAFIRAGMNINTESVDVAYRLAYDTEIRVEIYDMAGVLVDVIYEGQASEGELYELHLQTDKISSGVYIYQFITDRETHIDKLQIIQ